jgi:hypothetical protein
MQVAEMRSLVDGVSSFDATTADRHQLCTAAADVRRLQSYLDGRAVAIARRLSELSCTAERDLAVAGRTSAREAGRLFDRAKVVDAAPVVGEALARGAVGGDHVDVFGRGWRSLEPELRPKLVDAAAELVAVAERSTPEEFDRAVKAQLRRLRRDGGQARLEQQKRDVRVRTWVDREGMWCLYGRFDPETGVRLHRRMLDAVASRFAETTPDLAPDDPLERADFVRAHALAALIDGGGGRVGPPEFIAVVDATTPQVGGAPSIDWGLPVELPISVLRRLWPTAVVHPVVLAGGIVVHAPGQLDMGRTTRLATPAQRRVLRAIYSTCGLPDCTVPFDLCDIHHVIWWEPPHNGATDLDNLLPACSRHHHAIHDRGWKLKLTPDRELTITYPDGMTTTVRPPRRT